ncbi:GIY-YIG nuclease family protein [Paenibacillus sp. MBLB4367]|uniref:GIY-YIG nuclease family protein n=1 Tax=Paenibacillus sp. MBLB4367 TaxID=3384767 RepID=UPI00390802F9
MNVTFSEPLFFAPFSKKLLPESAGLYMLLSEKRLNGKYDVLYVGQSDDLKRRIGEHLNSEDSRIRQHVKHFTVSFEPSSSLRDSKERELIAFYGPPINKQLLGLSAKNVPSPVPPRLESKLPRLPFRSEMPADKSAIPTPPKPDDLIQRLVRARMEEEKRKQETLNSVLKKLMG